MPELQKSVAKTFEIIQSQPERFLLVGSYGRAALLGDSIADHASRYGTAKRFQDVDVLDLSGELTTKYSVPGGADLDSLLTGQYRLLDGETWGFFDRHQPSTDPLVTLETRFIPTVEIEIPDIGTITTFGPQGHLMQTHSLDYAKPYPKHAQQVARVSELTDYAGSEADQAITEYTAKMKERHTTIGLYRRLNKGIFNASPGLALAISDSLIGSLMRTIRKSNYPLTPLADELSDQREAITIRL